MFYSCIIKLHYVVYVLIPYLGISRHKTVDIAVDLLEDESTIHKRETALFNKRRKIKMSREIDLEHRLELSQKKASKSQLKHPALRTLMKTARLWLALRAASRLSLYF